MIATAPQQVNEALPYGSLTRRIQDRTTRVGIVGLGYVGLPLAVEYAKAGYSVTGIDVQPAKTASLNSGESNIQDVPSTILRQVVVDVRLRYH